MLGFIVVLRMKAVICLAVIDVRNVRKKQGLVLVVRIIVEISILDVYVKSNIFKMV